MIHPGFMSLRHGFARGLATAALLAVATTGARAEAAIPAENAASAEEAFPAETCTPLESEPSTLPDLQQGAHALCRAIAGDTEGGPFAKRLRLRIGGWADGSYQDTDHSSDEESLGLDHANLYVDARLDERWQLFFEGEWEHEPELEGGKDEWEWEVEQLYGDARFTDALRLRVGRFSTPFGEWTPIHWSILVDTIEPPIHEHNRLVPEQQLGGRLHGTLFADRWLGIETELDYSLFGGYADDALDPGNADGLTLGSDASVRIDGLYRLGLSLYTQENGDEDDRRENNAMLYGEAQLPFRIFVRSEYMRQHRDDTPPGITENADIVYAKARWDFRDDAYLNYRFEFGDDDRYGTTVEHTVHRVTLGVRPIPRIRLKAEWARHIYEGSIENYDFWGLSAGIFF